MSTFTYQVLKDTTEKTIIKLTGQFTDGTQEANNKRITANTLSGALDTSKANLLSAVANTGPLNYYGLSVTRIWYDCNFSNGVASTALGNLNLFWSATTNVSIAMLSTGQGEYNGEGNWASIPNFTANTPGANGNIGITTTAAAASDSYTIIMELRKDNAHYNRGQLTEAGAFNYPPYGIHP